MRYLLAIAICALIPSVIRGEDERRVITVSAQSEFRVSPDEAIISFSILTRDDKLLAAKTENDSLTTAIINVVRAHGITADSFKVTNLRIGPRHDRNNNFVDYRVERSFAVRTEDFARLDQIIGGIVDAGGDSISISELTLQVRDQRKHQVEARRLAVEYAREKASHLAELSQMTLGSPITISEDVEYSQGGGGGFGGAAAVDKSDESVIATAPASSRPRIRSAVTLVSMQKDDAQANDKPKQDDDGSREILLSPGQIDLNARVTIVFQLLPKDK